MSFVLPWDQKISCDDICANSYFHLKEVYDNRVYNDLSSFITYL